MNVGDMVAETKLMLHVNSSQLNDDISPDNYKLLLTQAYQTIWTDVRTEVAEANLLAKWDIEWPADEQTLTLPLPLQDQLIWDIWQLGASNQPVCPAPVHFEVRNVLRFDGVAPLIAASNKLRIYFVPDAEKLVSDNQRPLLIPPAHHRVIVWRTLCDIKMLWDKVVPDTWAKRLDDSLGSLLQELRTRPVAHRANIKPRFRDDVITGLQNAVF